MKKHFISKLLSVLVIVAVLTGCGASRFSHRHYHRDLIKVEPAPVEQKTGVATSDEVQKNEKKNVEVKNQTEEVVRVESPTVQSEIKKEEGNATINSNGTIDQAIINEVSTESPANEKTIANPDLTNNEQSNTSADSNIVLLVILAIFIPPLAVFLFDGSATTMFWITLLLCILGGGFLWGWPVYLGGLWGLAVILAILHILEII